MSASTWITTSAETSSAPGTFRDVPPSPLHLIRFNPDQFQAEGTRRKMSWPRRTELLLEAIQANVSGVAYVCFDSALKLTVSVALILALVLVLRLSVGPARL